MGSPTKASASPTKASPTKSAPGSPKKSPPKPYGKLVFAGAVSWDWIGRRTSKGTPSKEEWIELEATAPKLYGPAAYINVAKVFTHCTSAHCVLIDDNGVAYTFGRNDRGQLGDGKSVCRDDPFPIQGLDGKVVDAATGRSHTLLLTDTGSVYASGENKFFAALGAAGDPNTFTLVSGLKDIKVTAISCGAEFSAALSEDGKIYAWGNPQYGQLGDGSDHQYIGNNNRVIFAPQPVKQVKGIEKKIVQISCGANHSHAIDEDGAVYSWGFAGYGRLGNNQVGGSDLLVPEIISGFHDRKNPAKKVVAGPTCSMAIDSRDTLHVWGKWKNSGDGGQGTPWSYPKYFTGLSGWTVRDISLGAFSLFALASTSEDVSTISWGQGCVHGEMGHGEGKPRSATNAAKVNSLEGVDVISVSAGQGHTLLLVDHADPILKTIDVINELVETAPEPSKSSGAAGGKKRKASADKPSTKSKK